MAAKRKTVNPLDELAVILPKMGATELIEAALRVLEEGADRADTYADLIGDENPPADALNEGLVFVLRFGDVYYKYFHKDLDGRIATAHRKIREAENDLQVGPLAVNSG